MRLIIMTPHELLPAARAAFCSSVLPRRSAVFLSLLRSRDCMKRSLLLAGKRMTPCPRRAAPPAPPGHAAAALFCLAAARVVLRRHLFSSLPPSRSSQTVSRNDASDADAAADRGDGTWSASANTCSSTAARQHGTMEEGTTTVGS